MSSLSGASFAKVRKLITVLKKCNGKAVIGGKDALISPKAAKILIACCLFGLVVALSVGMYFLEPALSKYIDAKSLSQTLMLAMFIMSFVLGVKDVVSVLYMADDLDILLPMPFSATQIVAAKLVIASSLPVTISLICMNSACLGYGIREGAGVLFVIGILLSSVLMPVTGIALATLLVVVFFRIFGFIRNRDLTIALGGIATFGLTIAYIVFSNTIGNKDSSEMTAAFKVIASIASVFPNISFMIRFMFEGSIVGILISLACSAAVILLAAFAVKQFYLSAALSMQKTASNTKAVTSDQVKGLKKNGAVKALTLYEARSAKRNPAYLIYGFVMSFVWPVIFALPLVLGNNTIGKLKFPIGSSTAVIAILFFAVMASCFSSGYNILAGTAFSREGSTFEAIRTLPIDVKDYYKSKRNFAMIICSIGSALYVLVGGIVCIITKIIPVDCIWAVLVGTVCSLMLNLLIINVLLLNHSKKPKLTWDSETEFARKLGALNVVVIVVGAIALILCIGILAFAADIDKLGGTRIVNIFFAVNVLIVSGISLIYNNYAVKTGAKNLKKVET